MRVLIAGASGRTGRLLTHLALERGHDVTALLRTTSRPLRPHPRLRVVTGDVLEPATLPPAVEGQDAVVSLLAPRPRTSVRVYVEGTRNLADAAAAAGVRRIVVVSAAGAGVDPRAVPWAYRAVLRIPVVARLYPRIASMEAELRDRTDLDWTVVRAPILTRRAPRGVYRVEEGVAVSGGLLLARADLADLLMRTVERGDHIRRVIAAAY